MPKTSNYGLESLFHPHSIALVGITLNEDWHWTRTLLDALLEFKFENSIYLVNPKGGKIHGLNVYRSLRDIPDDRIDYVISTVPAKAAPGLVEECSSKGVKAIHFCTAGFSETGEDEGVRLEADLVKLSRQTGIRVIGPNCMGIYCPASRLSFNPRFPKESGQIGIISQSGGISNMLITEAGWRGVRFSKVISYGNACDLNESDFLKYLTADPATKIIGLYIEGIKDGNTFRRTLEEAAQKKVVVLLKGGVTKGGANAVASHTGSLAGTETTWDSLCRQLGVMRVHSVEELSDLLVTLVFMPIPAGNRAALIGIGGGAGVMFADYLEKSGLTVPRLPSELVNQIRAFTSPAGNMLMNPVDYGQTLHEVDKFVEAIHIVSRWEGIDFLTLFICPSMAQGNISPIMDAMLKVGTALKLGTASVKPLAIVIVRTLALSREEITELSVVMHSFASLNLPVYCSFDGVASAILYIVGFSKSHPGKLQNLRRALCSPKV
jgi:acyl-CoA synthetase (NDP forming)